MAGPPTQVFVVLYRTLLQHVVGIPTPHSPSQKREAKEFSVPRLVRYVLDSSFWLHDLDGDNVAYLSEEQFNNLEAGDSVEADEGVEVGTWCIVRHVPSEFDDLDGDDGDDDTCSDDESANNSDGGDA